MIPLRTWRSSKGLIMPFSSAICLIHRSLLITVKPSYSPVGPGVKSWAAFGASRGRSAARPALAGLLPAGAHHVHREADGLAGGTGGAQGIFHGTGHAIRRVANDGQDRRPGPAERRSERPRVLRGLRHLLEPREEALTVGLMQPVAHGDLEQIAARATERRQEETHPL